MMRLSILALLILVTGAKIGWGQLPTTQDTLTSPPKTPPLPDKDGIYGVVEGIVPPTMVHAQQPVFPSGQTEELAEPLICLVGAVIGVDGTPSAVRVTRGCNDAFAASAVECVTKSTYQPGTLDEKPVPVLVHVRVAYQNPIFPNSPRLALRYREDPPGWKPPAKPWDTPPKAIHTVEAEFSEQARRKQIEGVVLISLVVNEEGEPTDVRVTRAAGAGLDEQAIKAVRQYRFRPATKDGKPVAAKISVEISFKLNNHRGID